MPPEGKHTGIILQRTRPATYREVVRHLGNGLSVNKIKKICRVSPLTINAVAEAQAESIEKRKASLRDISERIAFGAAEQIEDALAAGQYNGSQLIPVYGVAVDKVVALSDAQPQKLDITVSAPNIMAEFQLIAQQIQAAVAKLPVQPVQATTVDAEFLAITDSAEAIPLSANGPTASPDGSNEPACPVP